MTAVAISQMYESHADMFLKPSNAPETHHEPLMFVAPSLRLENVINLTVKLR